MTKKINIIGAGIAGLSAGCYLQMNGYDTEIFELHDKPGGLCTAWERQGYTIDGCIHWLVGVNPDEGFYRLWNELIDMSHLPVYQDQVYLRIEEGTGRAVTLYRDVDRLEEELVSIAPEDKRLIRELTTAIRKFTHFKMPVDTAEELMRLRDGLRFLWKALPYGRQYFKWINISIVEFAARFKNPLLRAVMSRIFLPDMAMLFGIFTFAWMNKKDAGYPIGGSLNFARLIEKCYLELGGKIHYRARVKKITTNDNDPAVADGIILEDGTRLAADLVISAADGHATIYDLLDGRFKDNKIEGYYTKFPLFPSYLQVSLGIARTFENEPSLLYLPVKPELEIDPGTTTDYIGLRIFNNDPTLAPAGKTVINATLSTYNYTYWQELKKGDPKQYLAEKSRIAEAVIDVLEKRFGNVRTNLEMTDVSSPVTVMRYTNNWKGSLEGWLLTKQTGFMSMKKTLPGLKNFYLIGQWVEPGGGVPTALRSGRNVAQVICHKDGRRFATTKAQMT